MGTARGRSGHKHNSKRGATNMERRNVGTNEKNPEQGPIGLKYRHVPRNCSRGGGAKTDLSGRDIRNSLPDILMFTRILCIFVLNHILL